MKHIARSLITALLASLLGACGGQSGGSVASNGTVGKTPMSCSVADQRSWLDTYMADQYFWFDYLGVPNTGAASLDRYFNSLLYQSVDRYSFTEPTTQFVQFYTDGTYVGYGYSLVWGDAAQTTLKVRQVEPRSPVGLAGLRRGDTIVSIDGYSPAQIVQGTPGRVSLSGISRTFVVRNATGTVRTFTVDSAEYKYVSVPATSVLTQDVGGKLAKVGYLVYQQFVTGSAGELAEAFNAFAAAGVQELVLDLRYNGGGSISVARNLASMVGGSELDGQTFAQLRYNVKHPENNYTYTFTAAPGVLPGPPVEGLRRVIIIASEGTASASELVINALRPFMDVVLIGATTYGKPYGFLPVDACETTYSAVNFESVNALGVGGYNNGIAPTCAVPDDLDHQLGDPSESRLSAALYFLKNGNCPASGSKASAIRDDAISVPRTRVFGEVPRPQMFAD